MQITKRRIASLKTIIKHFNQIENYIMILILPTITLLVFISVVMRQFDLGSIPWADELSRYLMITLGMMGISSGFRDHSHLGMNVVLQKLKPKARRIAEMIRAGLILAFGLLMTYASFRLVENQRGFVQLSPSMGIPMYRMYTVMLIGWILMLIRVVQAAYDDFIGEKSTIKDPKKEGN